MLLMARRFGIFIVFAIGTIFAFRGPFLNVSPIVWLAIGVLCCSVMIGLGMQGLISGGFTDRKWVLATTSVLGVLAIGTLLLATKYFQVFAGLGKTAALLFTETAKMYILGTIATAIIFFMARAKLRVIALRLAILCSATAVDIFLGARFIVDKVL